MLRCLPRLFPLWCFVVAALFAGLGYWLGAKPAPPTILPAPKITPPTVTITLDFYGYDVEGKRVDAHDEKNTTPLNTTSLYEITRDVNTEETITFLPDDAKRYAIKHEKVKWRSNVEHKLWLDQQEANLIGLAPDSRNLWKKLFKGYRDSTSYKGKTKFDYPVIFETQKAAGKTH